MTITPRAVAVLSIIIFLNIEGAPIVGWCGNGNNNNNNKKLTGFLFRPGFSSCHQANIFAKSYLKLQGINLKTS